jgi:hypothetical protein
VSWISLVALLDLAAVAITMVRVLPRGLRPAEAKKRAAKGSGGRIGGKCLVNEVVDIRIGPNRALFCSEPSGPAAFVPSPHPA